MPSFAVKEFLYGCAEDCCIEPSAEPGSWNVLEADAIELPSLPMAINRVTVQHHRHLWPSVGAAILLRPLSHNTVILPASHLCQNPPHTHFCTTPLLSLAFSGMIRRST